MTRTFVALTILALAGCDEGQRDDEQKADEPEVPTELSAPLGCGSLSIEKCADKAIRLGFIGTSEKERRAVLDSLEPGCDIRTDVPCAGDAEPCFARKGKICRASAVLLGPLGDRAKARSKRKIACEIFRDKQACRRLAKQQVKGPAKQAPDSDVDDARVGLAESLKKRCDAKDWEACGILAVSISEGRGMAKDIDKGRALFEAACKHHGKPCYLLATRYKYGIAFGRDYAKARRFYRKGCDLKNGDSCLELGNLIKYGRGGKPDLKAATPVFKQGCDLGHAESCVKLRRANSGF